MPTALVVGAGVFGAALADRLVASGWAVTLVDRFEPGDPRSESGGETRLMRFSHGADSFYARSAKRAHALWRELGESVLVESGVAWFARRDGGWEADSERVLRAEGIPVERLAPTEARRLFPSLATEDLEFVLLEPSGGVLRAADGVRALVARARENGLRLVRAEAYPAGGAVALGGASQEANAAAAGGGRLLEADCTVWACGAWLAGLFPELVRLRVTRQELVLFDVPPDWAAAPAWLDFDASFYGHCLIEPHGMKAGSDREGDEVEPDRGPAEASKAGVAAARDYLSHRFPALAGAPVRSAPTCHYSLTADSNFLFARHPDHEHVWLLGGGSGHGFKHGPVLAEHAAEVLAGRADPEPRFGLGERTPAGALRTAQPGGS